MSNLCLYKWKTNKFHLKLNRAILILTFYLVYCLVLVVLAFPLVHHRKDAGKPQVNKLRSQSDLEAIDQLVQESTELENGLRNLEVNLTEVCFREAT